MAAPIDSVLLIAFGGPTRAEEIRPFLANVARGRAIPTERLEAVVHHYEQIGGRSPLNDLTDRQAAALRIELAGRGRALPVYVGMRHWHPLLPDTLAAMHARGHRHVAGLILSPQQNDAGWDRYLANVADARAALGTGAPTVSFAAPWPTHRLFIEAVAERTQNALHRLAVNERAGAHVVFTAHSIPVAMAAASPYVDQVDAGARAVAMRLKLPQWSIAYQSRTGNPRDPWLEPDINDALRALAQRGVATVVAVPIGFVCDHVEVLYDLDIEACATAMSAGLRFERAGAVNDHPVFVRMLADLVMETSSRNEGGG